jgi:triacylglycerol lipase
VDAPLVARRAARPEIPAEIVRMLRAARGMPQDQARDAMRAVYLPLLKAQPRESVTIEMDLAYGPHARHRLDVHVPKSRPTGAPVVMFFFGGGFVRGHKNEVGELLFGNVADFFARNGYIGINANYRLAEHAGWPAGGEDVGAAVAWARQNVAVYGGDPGRIFIMGHSSGATHVATYAFRPQLHPSGGPGIRGVLCMSGNYFLNQEKVDPNHVAYYGADMSRWNERSLIGNATWGDFAVFLSTAEHEPFPFNRSFVAMTDTLCARGGRMPRVKYFLEHNHSSEQMAIGSGDPTIEHELLDFVRGQS